MPAQPIAARMTPSSCQTRKRGSSGGGRAVGGRKMASTKGRKSTGKHVHSKAGEGTRNTTWKQAHQLRSDASPCSPSVQLSEGSILEFSCSLAGRLRSSGILISTCLPGWFMSNFSPTTLTRCGSPLAPTATFVTIASAGNPFTFLSVPASSSMMLGASAPRTRLKPRTLTSGERHQTMAHPHRMCSDWAQVLSRTSHDQTTADWLVVVLGQRWSSSIRS